MRLYCKNCGYRFESDSIPEICPYCGSKNSINKEVSAQDLLEEVEE